MTGYLPPSVLGNLPKLLARFPTIETQPTLDWVRRSFVSLRAIRSRGLSTDTRGSEILPSSREGVALACNVYISQGRDERLIQSLVGEIEQVSLRLSSNNARDRRSNYVALGHVFMDTSYNRTGFTLVASSMDAMVQGAVALSQKALSGIDLREHDATHPRLGVVDHISCHPLRSGKTDDLDIAGDCARNIARILGDVCGIPTFLYGTCKEPSRSASSETSLASIRRRFGYFKMNHTHGAPIHGRRQEWKGLDDDWLESMNLVIKEYPPDFGPNHVSPNIGIACVGSLPWVINHNVVLNTTDVSIAKNVAKRVSERGGGLQTVQAMGLEIDGGVEVACNLLNSEISSCDMVDSFIAKELAGNYGDVSIVRSYQTGKPVSQLLEMIH